MLYLTKRKMINIVYERKGQNMLTTHAELKKTIIRSQHVQRNWDLEKDIPEADLNLLIHAVTQCPSKQNIRFYKVHFITNRDVIENVHKVTDGLGFRDNTDQFKLTTNSQTLANLLVIFEDVKRSEKYMDSWKNHQDSSQRNWSRDQDMAIGVAAGYANITAAMLGYGTGCCACYNPDTVKDIVGLEMQPLLMMGIGFSGSAPRRTHHVTGETMPTHKKETIEVNIFS